MLISKRLTKAIMALWSVSYFFVVSNKRAIILFIAALLLLLGFYYYVDPSQTHIFFCPFRTLTGLNCPACGNQRALYALLHGRLREAIAYNPYSIVLSLYLLGLVSFPKKVDS